MKDPIQSRYLKLREHELHYLEAGSGPPVVLLHGWPTNAQLYRHALAKLAPHRRAIALDLPGFGKSSKPTDVRYSFRFFESVLTEAFDALEIDRLGLAVHDLGGPVGLYWAAQHRERVSEVAILNTLVFPETSWAVKLFVLATFVPGLRRYITSRSGIAAAMRFGVQDKARITAEVAELYTSPFAGAFSTRGARRALLQSAQGLSPRGMRAIADALPSFDMPVSVLYGEDDRILPDVARTMRRVKQLIPHAKVESLPRCGHFLQEDRPEEVADWLGEVFRV